MKRKIVLFFSFALLLLATAVLSACGTGQEETPFYLYFLNNVGTRLEQNQYVPVGDSSEAIIADVLNRLEEGPVDIDLRTPLPIGVELLGWTLEQHMLTLDFSSAYLTLPLIEEIMGRAAMVYTLIQIEGVDGILFAAGGNPLIGGGGVPLGLMTADSFAENPGEEIGAMQVIPLTLYFASEDGTHLVEEIREMHYSRNLSLEKLVMEQLIDGPEDADLLPTIPSATRLLNISLLNGLCFVNLDEGFLGQNFAVKEGVVIYSIVNSLSELPNVNHVQIAVNGDTNMVYREFFSLDTTYTRNLDYLYPIEVDGEGTAMLRGGRVRN